MNRRVCCLVGIAGMMLAVAEQSFADLESAETNSWFDAKIESYFTWPTNDVAAFGGEWLNVECAELGANGLEFASFSDDGLSFAAENRVELSSGGAVFSFEFDCPPLAEPLEFAFRIIADGGGDVFQNVVQVREKLQTDFSGFLHTAIEIDGAEEGFEKVAECGWLGTTAGSRFSFSEKEREIELKLACIGDVGIFIRDVGADFR